jgi:hypothetical protein
MRRSNGELRTKRERRTNLIGNELNSTFKCRKVALKPDKIIIVVVPYHFVA